MQLVSGAVNGVSIGIYPNARHIEPVLSLFTSKHDRHTLLRLNTLNNSTMYAKVFAQMYDGSLCTHGSWQALVTFQQLLVLADQEGAVDMTAEAISRRTTIPLQIIEDGIAELLKPDSKSRTPTEQGRRIVPLADGRDWGWLVVNYKHYRQLKREEDRREYHREYWHKRKTQQTQQTQPNQPIAEAYAEAEAEAVTPTPITPDTDTRKSKAKRPAKPAVCMSVSDLVSEGVEEQIAKDWLAIRHAKRLPLTKTAWSAVVRESGRAGMAPGRAVEAAVERSWVGFRAEWLEKEKTRRNGAEPAWRTEQREKAAAYGGRAAKKPQSMEYIDAEPVAKLLG